MLYTCFFQLPLGALHAEAVRDGRIDFHRLQRFGALFIRRLIGHRAHVVETVGNLDQDDADVLCHRQQHFAQILHLLVFLAGILHTGQLGNALDDIRDGSAELAGNIFVAETGIFNDVM